MPQFKSGASAPVSALWCVAPMVLLAGMPQHARAAEPADAAAATSAAEASAAAQPSPVAAGLQRYLSARPARFIDWLADGSMLIATRFGATQQVHRLRAPLGMREQLSFEPGEVLSAAARPYGSDAFIYEISTDGGRTSSLRLMRVTDHSVVSLTGGGFRDGLPLFAHDGAHIAFSSNRGQLADRAIFVQDTANPTAVPRLVAGSAGERWRIFDWSPDDRRLLLGRDAPDAAAAELYFADLQSGAVVPIQLPAAVSSRGHRAEAPSTLRARSARIAPDGHGLLVLGLAGPAAEPGAQFVTLRYVDPGSGEARELLPATPHDVEQFDASPDGRYLAYTVIDEGVSRLMLIDQKARLESAVGDVPSGIIRSLKFDATGVQLAFSVETAQSPEDVYVYAPGTQTLTRWSAGERGPVDPAVLVSPQLRRFPTWDRVDGQPRMLSAYVYGAGTLLPPDAAPRPVLILLRGTQGGQFRPGYEPFLQYLVNELRFVVVVPNLRGAGGYGRSFRALSEGALGNDAARDVGSLLAWVGLQDGLDRARVFVMGEGAADHLALTVLAQYGDRLHGGIAAGPPTVPSLPDPLTIRRPVLLVGAHPLSEPPGDPSLAVANDAFAVFAFRLRASGGSAEALALRGDACGGVGRPDRDAYQLAVAEFLAQLLR
jgi:dipeptidyl aminopeptidase/acylaminoacyl peptidase